MQPLAGPRVDRRRWRSLSPASLLTTAVVVLTLAGVGSLAFMPTASAHAHTNGTQPKPPIPLLPGDGSSVSSPTPTFTWMDGGGDLTYVEEVASTPVSQKRDGSFMSPLIRTQKLTSTSYTPSVQLTEGTTYAWHLQGRNGKLVSAWSQIWTVTISSGFVYTRLSDPARTVVTDSTGAWLATFTDGASTVTLSGLSREFSEPSAADPVDSAVWVRILPAPFSGVVDAAWLTVELTDPSPDVLATAMQYIEGAPPIYDESGLKFAGDADFGPFQPDGTRAEGSDFNDYLGIPWTYPGTVDQPEADQINSLDCSGFMRMLWGYRTGLPLGLSPDGVDIPRRSFEILDSAPGIVTVPNAGIQVVDFARLSPGDVVFFDASTDDGTQIDHVGMYLGTDTGGHYRFISSRKTANGPTLGDLGGKSILDGTGLYATAFRAARRF